MGKTHRDVHAQWRQQLSVNVEFTEDDYRRLRAIYQPLKARLDADPSYHRRKDIMAARSVLQRISEEFTA